MEAAKACDFESKARFAAAVVAARRLNFDLRETGICVRDSLVKKSWPSPQRSVFAMGSQLWRPACAKNAPSSGEGQISVQRAYLLSIF